MAALTADRNTLKWGALPWEDTLGYGVAASTVIYQGALVCLNAAGDAIPGTVATTLIAVGRAEGRFDNSTGTAGAIIATIRQGTFKFGNSTAGDAITKAERGKACYVVDDATVAKTDGGATRSKAGIVRDVDADGSVWVRIMLGGV